MLCITPIRHRTQCFLREVRLCLTLAVGLEVTMLYSAALIVTRRGGTAIWDIQLLLWAGPSLNSDDWQHNASRDVHNNEWFKMTYHITPSRELTHSNTESTLCTIRAILTRFLLVLLIPLEAWQS